MENPWLCVEDIDEQEQVNGAYMGVFNRPPSVIARSLPRPMTPSPNRVPQFQISSSKVQAEITSEDYLESPVLRSHTPGFLCGRSLVSVF